MKPKIASVLIAVIFGTVALCSTISHANDQQSIIKAVVYNTSDIAAKQVTIMVKHGSNQINILKMNTYDAFINRPLLSLSSSVKTNYIPAQNFTKKNKIFELATLFNDKLQQILAKLSFNESPKHKARSIIHDKPKDKNAINCEVKKIH
jgi:hypothetical protein